MNGHIEGIDTASSPSSMDILNDFNCEKAGSGNRKIYAFRSGVNGTTLLNIHKCPECGKVFECFNRFYRFARIPKGKKHKVFYCSYTCYRKEEINAKQPE